MRNIFRSWDHVLELADTYRHAANDLSFDQHRVDGFATVVPLCGSSK